MLLSHSNKFIFIHIFKTAGSSVRNEFVDYSRFIDKLAYKYKLSKFILNRINKLMGWLNDGMVQFTGFSKHATASEIKTGLPSNIFDDYFKFIFVRNPYDLMVSQYFYSRQKKWYTYHNAAINKDFSEFVSWYIAQNPQRQTDFLLDQNSKELIVDYIGRFESISSDLEKIKSILNINSKQEFSHVNPSIIRKNKDYKVYYDSKSQKLVEDYFKDDLEQLGYTFEGFETVIPILNT